MGRQHIILLMCRVWKKNLNKRRKLFNAADVDNCVPFDVEC
jgi:hypothetical protein